MPQLDPSAFWGIAGIVVGIIVASIFFFLGKKKTLLEYDISTNPLITEKMAGILNDRMSIDGQPVKSMLSTTISFINSGNQRIKSADFSEQDPLCIILKGHLYGYDVSLGNQKLLPKAESINDKVLNISFENLKPRQFFRVMILHNETLDVSGELTTGNMRKLRSSFSKAFPFMAAAAMMDVVLCVDLLFDGPITTAILETDFHYAILIALTILMFTLCVIALVVGNPSPLHDDDDINKPIKEDRNLLKTIGRIFGK